MRSSSSFSKVLPVPQWLIREGIYLTHAGWEKIEPNEAYPRPHSPIYFFEWEKGRILPEFCLSLCAAGGGDLETKSGKQSIRVGESFLFRTGEWHRHRPDPTTGWVNLWMHFNGSLPHQWMRDGAFQLSGNKVDVVDRALFQRQFERLLETIHRHPHLNSAAISWQALGLLSHFVTDHRAMATSETQETDHIARRASDFIMNHTHSTIDVKDVAAHVGCSRRTLETRFKRSTGRTVLEEIHRCRAVWAKSLLMETDMPMKQITHQAGFRSREHMRLVFLKFFGVTPSHLRNPRPTVPDDSEE